MSCSCVHLLCSFFSFLQSRPLSGQISLEILRNPCTFALVKFTPAKPSLFGETLASLKESVEAAGFPSFRAKQVMEWLYKKRVDQWDAMSNLPKAFRVWLDDNYILYFAEQLTN